MKIRKILVGVAGLAAAASLIGLGAGASFTDAVSATQHVTAGSLNMTVAGPVGSTTDGKTVTLADVGPFGSTFNTGQQLVTTTNSGNITANAIHLSVSGSTNNAALLAGLNIKIESWASQDMPGGPAGAISAYDGPLSAFPTGGMTLTGPVAAGHTDPFYVTFSAANLPQDAQGGTVTPSITVTYEG